MAARDDDNYCRCFCEKKKNKENMGILACTSIVVCDFWWSFTREILHTRCEPNECSTSF